ncbi:MAG: hypothetical protein HRU03_02480 [Nanoarchaeales archaeon]|nr:hypothetical protein [Nanoarchaeales archaeon]
MSDKNWRNNLDLVIEQNLNELINETYEYDYAIKKAKDKSKAQMWVALAIINKKLNDLSLEKVGRSSSKIPKDEMSKILKTLETL